MTQSKFWPSVAKNSSQRFDPSSSAGFGGIMPAGSTHRFCTDVLRIDALGLQSPTRRFDNPGSWAMSKIACTRGRRMSASTWSTRWPAWASETDRLLENMLLPSPGPALVTTISRTPSSADENSTLVRTPRMASAKLGGTPS